MEAAELRQRHYLEGLREEDVDADPFREFRRWYDGALAAGLTLPDAMTLATATPDGIPSARMVLLKGFDERGFQFFTDYTGRKGNELAVNPRAALVFFWAELDRQVRIEGTVERLSAPESDAYFRTRPLGSRISAWASPQSQVVAGRQELERRVQDILNEYPYGNVPRPPHWGGFRVVPSAIEFWQGRPDRLHDRLRYQRQPDGGWRLQRLAP
jgi:pyridoxamine 5'-phosphate oxidase